jgi:hypothetical protein
MNSQSLFTMNIRVRLIVACALALTCVACTTGHYRLTLKDGREFMTANEPQINVKTGYFRFKNLQGKDALIRADEVLLIDKL